MKKNIILGLFTLSLMASSALAAPIETVLVTTNTLIISFTGSYSDKQKVLLGTNSLPWSQAGKSENIIATLPPVLASGTYRLQLAGHEDVSVEIGSVRAEAALSDSISAEVARATAAEAGLSNGINAEAGLSNSISAETARATGAETDLGNLINSTASAITGNINSTSNSIVASLTKDLSVVTLISSVPITNIFNQFIPFTTFTNGTVTTIGDTNGWSANGTLYTVPATGIYEVSFSFGVSSAPDSINDILVIDDTVGIFKTFSFPAVASGYATWSGQTTFQCNAGDAIGFGSYSSLGDNLICGPEPLLGGSIGPVNVMEVSIKQIQ